MGLTDVGYFPEEAQNLFAPCNGKIQRHFEFVGADNKTMSIVEQVPCSPSTLREKIASFDGHDIDRDGNYFEVHTRMATASERKRLDETLHATMVVPEALSVDRMTVPIVTHFFHAGRTAVYYLHAHMDRFLSFCLQEEKRWTLVAPQHFKHFEHRWSGNAEMMLRETTPAPRLEVTQRRGDVLFVPPWWIHETRVAPGSRNPVWNANVANGLDSSANWSPVQWYSDTVTSSETIAPSAESSRGRSSDLATTLRRRSSIRAAGPSPSPPTSNRRGGDPSAPKLTPTSAPPRCASAYGRNPPASAAECCEVKGPTPAGDGEKGTA